MSNQSHDNGPDGENRRKLGDQRADGHPLPAPDHAIQIGPNIFVSGHLPESLRRFRADPTTVETFTALLERLESLDLEQIQAMVKYIAEDSYYPGGAARSIERYFEKPLGTDGVRGAFCLYASHNLSDKSFIYGADLAALGIRLGSDSKVDRATLRSIPWIENEKLIPPGQGPTNKAQYNFVYLEAQERITLEAEVFEEVFVTLSRGFDPSKESPMSRTGPSKRWPLYARIELPNEGVGPSELSMVEGFPKDYGDQLVVPVPLLDTREGRCLESGWGNGYAYYHESSLEGNLIIENVGPQTMAVRLWPIDALKDELQGRSLRF